MVRTDRLAIWILIVTFVLLIPGIRFLKLTDELACAALLTLACADTIANGRAARFRLLWYVIAIAFFYLLYTLAFCHFNTTGAVCGDFIIEMKPYIPFAVMLGLAPRPTVTELTVLKWAAVTNAAAATLCMLCGLTDAVLYHPLYGGAVIFISMLVYVYSCWALEPTGRGARRCLAVATVMILCGLACTRSKYYGEAVVALFFLWVYRPGMFRRINMRSVAIAAILILLVGAVSWSKFNFYFITGASAGLDRDTIQSFARPALYGTSLLILCHYVPFGSGLASFASYFSTQPYSSLYFRYGLDKIYGLSPMNHEFVCDAFYPSLAQTGIAGVGLFVWFWVYIASLLMRLLKTDPGRFRLPFAVGALVIVFIMIENVASTLFTQSSGLVAMCLLGIICGMAPEKAREKKPEPRIIR